jgi:Uri superfamily endonuclease
MLHLQPGWYAYAGSAFGPGGLRARLARHLRGGSKRHWHIDYLRPHAPIYEIWYSPKTQNCEHRWAAALGHITGAQIPLPGFGSSDCRCAAHLFFFAASADAWKRIETDAWKRIETDAWKRIETDAWKRIESDSW